MPDLTEKRASLFVNVAGDEDKKINDVENRLDSDPVVRLVSRPRVVQQLSTGPFVVTDSGNGQFVFDDDLDATFVDAPLRWGKNICTY